MLRRRSVAIELRLRADAEAKRAAKARLKSIMLRFTTGTLAGKIGPQSEIFIYIL